MMMNYQQWRVRRDELIEQYQPTRLDCMNPFYALDFMRLRDDAVCSNDTAKAASLEQAVHAWADCAGIDLHDQPYLPTRGVRSLLRSLCQALATASQAKLWMPSDVFPTYQVIAQDAGIAPGLFTVMPRPDFTPLDQAGPNDVLLLPLPLTPIGRGLCSDEVDWLIRWLKQSPGRAIVLDLVYAYRGCDLPGLAALVDTGQCIQAWSISKTWIQRQVFGIAVAPEAWTDRLRQYPDLPSAEQVVIAHACFSQQLDLPQEQQARFKAQWQALAPVIRAAHPDWAPPEIGYFSILPIASGHLLSQHNLLAIPASVFGSTENSLSIITCLHDIDG